MAKSIAISSAHGRLIRGAKGPKPWGLDEVDESRRVCNAVAGHLRSSGVTVHRFDDDVSKTQSANLKAIVAWHNRQNRSLDVSIHFNAHKKTNASVGVECLYITQQQLAKKVAAGIAYVSPLHDRGEKKRTGLAVLKTNKPAILLEVCFVDSKFDCEAYLGSFNQICHAIAAAIR
jgi:N-acetylmuramoyl-L-alanine amidase